MNIMSFISSVVKNPDPYEAARQIVQACSVWGANYLGRPVDHFLDEYVRSVKAEARSYADNKVYYDDSETRIRSICVAASLAYVFVSSDKFARKARILNEIKERILDAAAQSVQDYSFQRKFYECHRFVTYEMHLLPPNIEAKFPEWQRGFACAANWMVQQFRSGQAEHYIEDDSRLFKDGFNYIIRASNTVDEEMHNLYTMSINESW